MDIIIVISEYVLEIQGSKGAVKARNTVCQNSDGDVRVCLLEGDKNYNATQKNMDGNYTPLALVTKNIYQAEIEAFAGAVLNDCTPPVSGRDGAWNIRVVEAVYESARTKRMIEL